MKNFIHDTEQSRNTTRQTTSLQLLHNGPHRHRFTPQMIYCPFSPTELVVLIRFCFLARMYRRPWRICSEICFSCCGDVEFRSHLTESDELITDYRWQMQEIYTLGIDWSLNYYFPSLILFPFLPFLSLSPWLLFPFLSPLLQSYPIFLFLPILSLYQSTSHSPLSICTVIQGKKKNGSMGDLHDNLRTSLFSLHIRSP